MFKISFKIIFTVLFLAVAFGASSQSHHDQEDEHYQSLAYQKGTQVQIINHIVNGYTDKLSYDPGDTVKVFLSANVSLSAKIYLLDAELEKKDSIIANIFPQTMAAVNPWENYGYIKTFNYVIPANLVSGMYNFGDKIFFIVRNLHKNADITIVYPTNTEAAYNNAGGKSLYNFNSSGNHHANMVTFQRPLENYILNEVQQQSRPFAKWIKHLHGYSIQYLSDQDLDRYSEISQSKLLVVIGHSEYWSRAARQNFDQFVNGGKNAAVFSGNTMGWQVRYSSDNTKIVCYKDSANDPEPNHLLKTIEWAKPSLNYSVLQSIGADWPHGAYGMYPPVHGNDGYTIMKPNSPLLQGTGLGYHHLLSCQSYEYDATLFSAYNAFGDPIIDSTTLGFCKMELIGYDYGEKVSNVYAGPKGYGTFIIFKKTPASGIVVNTGFNTFTGQSSTLGTGGINGPDSGKVRLIVRNIFTKLLAHHNVFTTPNSCTTTGIQDLAAHAIAPHAQVLYPNPGNGYFSVMPDFSNEKNARVEVYDLYGRHMYTGKMELSSLNHLDLSELNDGVYQYGLYVNDVLVNQNKIVIVK